MDATAVEDEAFQQPGGASFADRDGFCRAAAVAMQRILVDQAGGSWRRSVGEWFDGCRLMKKAGSRSPTRISSLDIDEAVNRPAEVDAGAADLARLQLVAGVSVEEAARATGLSRAAAFREWSYARAWLTDALAGREGGAGG